MNRREWLKSFAAGALTLGTAPWCEAVAAALRRRNGPLPPPVTRAPGDYSVIVLGDTHFDGLTFDTYHSLNPTPSDSNVEFQRRRMDAQRRHVGRPLPVPPAGGRRAHDV